MNRITKPIFIDFNAILRNFYGVLGIIIIYNFLVQYIDVSAATIFEVVIDYTMYAELIFGVFTASAWVCINLIAVKMEHLLMRIPNFKFDSVMNVWDLYFLAWRGYTCYTGFILAALIFLEQLILG